MSGLTMLERRRLSLPGVLAMLLAAGAIAVALILVLGNHRAGSGGSAALKALMPKLPVSRRAGPPRGAGSLVAIVRHRTIMRGSPSGRALGSVGTRTEFGAPEVLWVVAHPPGWLGVISPLAGNGHVGWIPRAVVSLTRVRWQLRISVSARKLTVLHDGRVVQRYAVAVGGPDAPTPTGRFAVTDRLVTGEPRGPYGCCILALSAHAPHTIQGWSGGDRIAIHSTPDNGSVGRPVSHGCVRVTLAESRWLLGHIPLGTPTLISS